MKQVPLRKMNVTIQDKSVPFGYADLFVSALNDPGKQGFTIDDVRQRVPLVAKLQKAEDEVLLEEAEYKLLVGVMRDFRFAVITPAIIQMIDELEGAATVEVKPA